MGFDKYKNKQQHFFEVSVNTPQEIFCNLPKTDYNTFSGEADSLTLVGGFYETININTIEVIYPYLFLTKAYPKEAMLSDIENFITLHKELNKTEKIIVVANINNTSSYERMTIYNDYITCTGIIGLSELFEEQMLNPEQKILQRYIELYENVPLAYQQLVDSAKENADENSKLILLFDEKLKLSKQLFLEAIKEYISKSSDETAMEFLNNWEATTNA